MTPLQILMPYSQQEPLSYEDEQRDLVNRLNSKSSTKFDCSICKGKGVLYRFDEQLKNIVSRDCQCVALRKAEQALKRSGLSQTMQDTTFDSYIVDSQWQDFIKKGAISYAENPKDWFFIGGQSGAGKTLICTAILTYLLKQSTPCRYMLWRDECNKLKATLNTDQFDTAISSFKTAKVLYIDDLFKVQSGKEVSGGDVNIAFEILNYRYNSNLPTIISTEHTFDRLLDIDEAVASRINEKSRTNRFVIKPDRAKNYRLR